MQHIPYFGISLISVSTPLTPFHKPFFPRYLIYCQKTLALHFSSENAATTQRNQNITIKHHHQHNKNHTMTTQEQHGTTREQPSNNPAATRSTPILILQPFQPGSSGVTQQAESQINKAKTLTPFAEWKSQVTNIKMLMQTINLEP